jgi:hypothetical protein
MSSSPPKRLGLVAIAALGIGVAAFVATSARRPVRRASPDRFAGAWRMSAPF